MYPSIPVRSLPLTFLFVIFHLSVIWVPWQKNNNGIVFVQAYRRYLNRLPNSDKVPCPKDNTGNYLSGCYGSSICEAWGHLNCESTNKGTAAGSSLEHDIVATQNYGWRVAGCSADNDNDGLTDGDELGDGCCAWPVYPVQTTEDISNPSFSTSVTNRASCSSSPPSMVSGITTSTCGKQCLALTWTSVPETVSCICEWEINFRYTVGSALTNITFGTRDYPYVNLCNLPSNNIPIDITVIAHNRAGASTVSTVVTGYAGSSSDPVPSKCSVQHVSPYYMNAADRNIGPPLTTSSSSGKGGSKNKKEDDGDDGALVATPYFPALPDKKMGIYWIVLVGVIVALGTTIIFCLPDNQNNWLRACCVHRYLYVRLPSSNAPTNKIVSPSPPPPSTAAPSFLHRIGRLSYDTISIKDLGEASIGYILTLGATVLALIGCAVSTYQYYDVLIFPVPGTKESIGRGAGYALGAVMGILLLPSTRFSVWLKFFGIPFERALKLHRYIGFFTVILTILHGVLLGLAYAQSQFGLIYLFTWTQNNAINPLAGFISGVAMILIVLLALYPIRRYSYEIFLVGHLLSPAAYVLAWIHLGHSETEIAPFFVAPLVLVGIDFLLTFLDMKFFRDAIVVDAGVLLGNGQVIGCGDTRSYIEHMNNINRTISTDGTVTPSLSSPLGVPDMKDTIGCYLVIDKLPSAFGWVFNYVPGQYVYIVLPHVSYVPHPISISSVEDPRLPGRFTLHIRSMGTNTWSGKLCTTVVQSIESMYRDFNANNESVLRSSSSSMPLVLADPTISSNSSNNSSLSIDDSLGNDSSNGGSSSKRSTSNIVTPLPQLALVDPQSFHHWPLPYSGISLPSKLVSHASATELKRWPIPPEIRHQYLRVGIAGSFGAPSVQFHLYRHFILIAGGIGITPIAPLHYSLVKGLPIEAEPTNNFSRWFVRVWKQLCCVKPHGKTENNHHPNSVNLLSLTTIWSLRETSLLSSISPLLITSEEENVLGTVHANQTRMVSMEEGEGSASHNPSSDPNGGTINPSVNPLHESSLSSSSSSSSMKASKSSIVDLHIHLTRRSPPTKQQHHHHLTHEDHIHALYDYLNCRPGRPNYEELFKAAAEKALRNEPMKDTLSYINIAVAVCGPPEMIQYAISIAQQLSGYRSPYYPNISIAFHVHRETFIM